MVVVHVTRKVLFRKEDQGTATVLLSLQRKKISVYWNLFHIS